VTELRHETQETIGSWIDNTFPGADPESPRKTLRALEEMVELCFAAGASPTDIRTAVQRAISDRADDEVITQLDKIPAEVADVTIVLYGYAQLRGFDLQAEIDKKMAINRKRKWKANGDGTGYHIKEKS
jgi:NTP pyrophosphatase (non-canonical NTP hydrolase)